MRPLNEKWIFTASLGAGVYTDLSQFSTDSIISQANVFFIWSILPGLDLGFGAALNYVLGCPMLVPSLYLDWKVGEQFEFKIALYDTWLALAGMKINDMFTMRLLAQAKSMSAIVDRNNELQIFSEQLIIIGVQPEIYVNKIFSIPITAGVSVIRTAAFQGKDTLSFLTLLL